MSRLVFEPVTVGLKAMKNDIRQDRNADASNSLKLVPQNQLVKSEKATSFVASVAVIESTKK